eukprot:4896032-Amphidinium_carterae.1
MQRAEHARTTPIRQKDRCTLLGFIFTFDGVWSALSFFWMLGRPRTTQPFEQPWKIDQDCATSEFHLHRPGTHQTLRVLLPL